MFSYGLLIGVTNWIDVCPENGNLLASGGEDNNVKIFDKRELNIVQLSIEFTQVAFFNFF